MSALFLSVLLLLCSLHLVSMLDYEHISSPEYFVSYPGNDVIEETKPILIQTRKKSVQVDLTTIINKNYVMNKKNTNSVLQSNTKIIHNKKRNGVIASKSYFNPRWVMYEPGPFYIESTAVTSKSFVEKRSPVTDTELILTATSPTTSQNNKLDTSSVGNEFIAGRILNPRWVMFDSGPFYGKPTDLSNKRSVANLTPVTDKDIKLTTSITSISLQNDALDTRDVDYEFVAGKSVNHRREKHSSLKKNKILSKHHRPNMEKQFLEHIWSSANLTNVTNRQSLLLAKQPNQQQDRYYEKYTEAESFRLTSKDQSKNNKQIYSNTSSDFNGFDYEEYYVNNKNKPLKASNKKKTFAPQLLQYQTNIFTNSKEFISIPDTHESNKLFKKSSSKLQFRYSGTEKPYGRDILGVHFSSESPILQRSFLNGKLTVKDPKLLSLFVSCTKKLRLKIATQSKLKFMLNKKNSQLFLTSNLPSAPSTPMSTSLQFNQNWSNIYMNTQHPPELFIPKYIGGQFERMQTPLQKNPSKSDLQNLEDQNSPEPLHIFNAKKPGVLFRYNPRMLRNNPSQYEIQYMPNNKGPRVLIKPNLPRVQFERVSPPLQYNQHQTKVLYIVPTQHHNNLNTSGKQAQLMPTLLSNLSHSDLKHVVNKNTHSPQKLFKRKHSGVHFRYNRLLRYNPRKYDIQYISSNKGPRVLIKPKMPKVQFKTVSHPQQYNQHQLKLPYPSNERPINLNLPGRQIWPVPILQYNTSQYNVQNVENQSTQEPQKPLNPSHLGLHFRPDRLLQYNRSQYDKEYMPSHKDPRVSINTNQHSDSNLHQKPFNLNQQSLQNTGGTMKSMIPRNTIKLNKGSQAHYAEPPGNDVIDDLKPELLQTRENSVQADLTTIMNEKYAIKKKDTYSALQSNTTIIHGKEYNNKKNTKYYFNPRWVMYEPGPFYTKSTTLTNNSFVAKRSSNTDTELKLTTSTTSITLQNDKLDTSSVGNELITEKNFNPRWVMYKPGPFYKKSTALANKIVVAKCSPVTNKEIKLTTSTTSISSQNDNLDTSRVSNEFIAGKSDNQRRRKHLSLKHNMTLLKQHQSNRDDFFPENVYNTINIANQTSSTKQRSVSLANKQNQQQYSKAESFQLSSKDQSRNRKQIYSSTSPDFNGFDYEEYYENIENKHKKSSTMEKSFAPQLLQFQTNIFTKSHNFYKNSASKLQFRYSSTEIPYKRDIPGLHYSYDLQTNPIYLGGKLAVRDSKLLSLLVARAKKPRLKIPTHSKFNFIPNSPRSPNLLWAPITPVSTPLQYDLSRSNIYFNTQLPPAQFNPKPIGPKRYFEPFD